VVAHSQHVDARGWITNVTKKLANDEFIRVAVRPWVIWHARKKAIHENIFQSPMSTYCFVERFISELQMILPSLSNPQPGKPLGPRWIPPLAGYAKINVVLRSFSSCAKRDNRSENC
jgi:hypothetical protein